MKKYLVLLASLVFFVSGCGSAPEVKQDTGDPAIEIVSAQNEQLENHPIGGFGYKSSALPSEQWDRWAESAAPVVQDIINKLPEGYVIQVTGHADAVGPEEPVGDKPGNIKISEDRAKTVYDALNRAGIESPKMTYKGAGSSELLEGIDPSDPAHRRVTFKILPAE